MKTKIHSLLIGLALAASLNQAIAQTYGSSSTFTYQGRLNDGTNPANGKYDFQFQVYDAATAGSSYGSPNPNIITNVGITNGLFTVALDFGSSVFTGPARWLQTSVRTNGATTYTLLNARQPLTATPYAIYAGNAATLGGQASTAYVAKAGDTMTGKLNLPSNGLNVGGSQLMTTNGNVGIGTSNPTGLLDVSDGSEDSILNGIGLLFTRTTGPAYIQANNRIDFETGGGIPGGDAGANLILYPGQISSFNGNVGVGTATPNMSLDIEKVNNGGYGAVLGIANRGSGAGTAAAIRFGVDPSGIDGGLPSAGTDYPNAEIKAVNATLGNNETDLAFSAWAGLSLNEVMRIKGASGNIGIGTNNPGAILDVANGAGNAIRVRALSPSGSACAELGIPFAIQQVEFGPLVTNYIAVYGNSGIGPATTTANESYAGYFDGDVFINGHTFADNISSGGSIDSGALECDNLTVYDQATITGSTYLGGSIVNITNNYSGNLSVIDSAIQATATKGVGLSGNGYIGVLGSTANIAYGRGVLGSANGGANSWGGLFTYGSNGNNAAYLGGNGAAAIFYGGVSIAGSVSSGHLFTVGTSASPAYCDGGAWVNGSDRNSKECFADINPREVLNKVVGLPISEWKYKVEADGIKHIGPMAQDFHAAFSLNGVDDKHIATVDEEGIALAAIQGLNQKLDEKNTEIENLKKTVDQLQAMMESLTVKK